MNTPYIVSESVVVRTMEEIKVGAVYYIRGRVDHPDHGEKQIDSETIIPPQVISVTGAPFRDSPMEAFLIPCKRWMDLGEKFYKRYYYQPDAHVSGTSVNVPEHGTHNIYLERVPDHMAKAFGLMEQSNKKEDYGEIMGL